MRDRAFWRRSCESKVDSNRVEVRGLLSDDELEIELRRADLALVSQRHGGVEFNMPSKLMTFMAYGLPIVAAVDPGGEVSSIVRQSGAGWVVDSARPIEFPRLLRELFRVAGPIARPRRAAQDYASQHFEPRGFASRFEHLLESVSNEPDSVAE